MPPSSSPFNKPCSSYYTQESDHNMTIAPQAAVRWLNRPPSLPPSHVIVAAINYDFLSHCLQPLSPTNQPTIQPTNPLISPSATHELLQQEREREGGGGGTERRVEERNKGIGCEEIRQRYVRQRHVLSFTFAACSFQGSFYCFTMNVRRRPMRG
jgi:hypothetical protein